MHEFRTTSFPHDIPPTRVIDTSTLAADVPDDSSEATLTDAAYTRILVTSPAGESARATAAADALRPYDHVPNELRPLVVLSLSPLSPPLPSHSLHRP